jgi:glycosyltransferase involved in cell wall biosynthesis
MELVHLPAARRKSLETLSHTLLSMTHLLRDRRRPDAAIVFNAANAPLLPMLRLRRTPVAVHVDGLEWRRTKWRGAGRRYYRLAEALSVRWADALIADAVGIADYYVQEFGASTELLTYGAPIQAAPSSTRITDLGLRPKGYHVVVARFEPENHVLEIVEGYAASRASLPLVVVGSAPYSDTYTSAIRRVADADERIRLLGGVWDADLLDELYANALTYLHGHSVGGTNPSLLRAMGGGASVLAFDVNFNREVTGGMASFFKTAADVAPLVEAAEAEPEAHRERGEKLRERARLVFCWDDVAAGYEELLIKLGSGESQRGIASGRRATVSIAQSTGGGPP